MDIKKVLKENNNRLTPERLSIYDFLKTKHLFTYSDINDNFRNISRASIFRTLNLFLELQIIRKVELWEKTMTYELNHENNHHEHMKCEKCSRVINFDSSKICEMIFMQAKKLWFEVKSHNIWLIWTCKNCLY